MNRRLILIFCLTLGMAGTFYFSGNRWSSHPSDTQGGANNHDQIPRELRSNALKLTQAERVGTATIRVPTPEEQQIADKLVAATKSFTPSHPEADLEPRATPVPKELLPRTPNLSEAQRRALQKLRWGITKKLNYQGDGEDATVRFLSSPALAEPLDPANPTAEPPGDKARRFVADNRELFLLKNPNNEIVVTAIEADPQGGSVIRMAQRYAGFDVWPGQLTANVSRAGYLTVVTGAYSPTPESIDLGAKVAPEAADEAARRHLGVEAAQLQQPSRPPILTIFADKGHVPELAYDIAIRALGKAERVFVSAMTGGVLLSFSEIYDAGTATTASDIFGQTRTINVQSSGTPVRYSMFDTSKPMYSATTNTGVIAIYDGSASPSPLSSSASATSGFDPVAVSAAYNLSKVYDFYSATFSRSSFDGKGTSIRAFVRYPDPKTNGPYKNASWDGQFMRFGNADAYAAASDVVGHEYTHAVVQYSANLIYNGESGALNESFADIMGEAFERYLTGTNDWLMGTLLQVQSRSMKNPQSKGQPATMSQYSRLTSTNDYGGVHLNSGITNYAFYLLAEGLPSGRIGFENARNIFYRALTTKLNSRSTFQDLRPACILSANELFGAGSVQATKTGQAFDAVEIFDASRMAIPDNLTPASGPDSYLITYKAANGNTYLGRREAALNDGTSVTAISMIPMDPNARASVSGDGSVAVFVSATHDVVIANTNGTGASAVGSPGLFNSVTVSADSKYLACIARDLTTGLPLSKMFYTNISTAQWDVIDLYLPAIDGPNSISITTVDEIDLSPDGQIALFDGFAKTTLADGTIVKAWSIFAVDLRTKAVFSLAPPIPDIDIGNPAFARTSDQRIIYEFRNSTSSGIFTVDLLHQTLQPICLFKSGIIFTSGNIYFAYPRFSAADDFVVYTEDYWSWSTFSYLPRVSKINLSSLDRLTAVGSPSVVQEQAYSGLSYRRGTFAGSPTLAVSALTPTLKAGQTGTFRIARVSGDQAIRVPFSFKVLGTAKSSVDYTQMQRTATIPAGGNFVDVTVQASASPSAPSRVLTFSLDPLSHYLIGPSNGDASITILANAAPSISSQPISQTVVVGSAATFSVGVTDPTAAFQWSKDGSAVSGATSSTLTLQNVGSSAAGSYTVVAANSAGSVTSTAATLTVNSPPTITVQPANVTITAGQPANLTVVATGNPPPSFQWRKNAIPITGATNATLAISNSAAFDAGTYTVVVTNSVSSITSLPATLTVNPLPLNVAPSITAQPSNVSTIAGQTASLTVVATGSPLPTVQWLKNGAPIAGATNATLTIANATGTDAGVYTCVLTNSAGSATSSAATLSVVPTSALSNVSVRTTMAAGQTLIVGAVVSGGSKNILVRAAGPALSAFGLSGMADPRLELYISGSSPTAVNDDWPAALASTFTSVAAFPFAAGSKDAAISQGLSGAFTVQCKGTGPGTVLVEAYDTTGGTSPRLVNISARNQVGVGSNILIAGFAISGTGSKQVLIRGIGPALVAFGVNGALADPYIRLFDSSSRMVTENDNWNASLASTFASVGAFPLVSGSKDAALLISLSAGSTYTVRVSGVNATTGEALVEIYEVQ
jgi:Zn-dependent metalloprotease